MEIRLDELSKEVAKRLGEKEHVIRAINRIQWKVVNDTVRGEGDRGIQLMYIGKFLRKKKPNYVIRKNI